MTLSNQTDAAAIDALAASFRAAELSAAPIPPITETHPDLSIADAYTVQRRNIDVRLANGEVRVGHKIGLTSHAIQQQLGVDQPDYGVVTDAMVVPNGGSIDAGLFVAPRVEAEFAFTIGHDLPPSPKLEELLSAVSGVAVSLEIIDSRVADWKIKLIDTIADNASCARIVHGDFTHASSALLASLPNTTIELLADGDVIVAGPGSAVLGDPMISLHWLATAIGAFGEHFSKGDVVLAGAVAAAVPLEPGVTWTARAAGLGPVTLTTAPRNQE